MKPILKIEGVDGVGVHHSIVNLEMLADHFDIAPIKQRYYDFELRFTTSSPNQHDRCVMAYMEPPIGLGYVEPHRNPGKYLAVFTFHPRHANQFPITEDPIVFPYPPNRSLELPYREDLTLETRRGYYAGARNPQQVSEPDADGRINLYGVRTRIIEALWDQGLPLTVYGRGWGFEDTRTKGDFQNNKLREIPESGAEFIFCLENSRLWNYISEKIQNGFQSDRLVLYLGEPNIHRHVPQDAFIDLNHYWDVGTRKFDAEGLARFLYHMPQSLYTKTIWAARKWRAEAKLEERRDVQSDLLTSRIIEKLKRRK